MYVTSAGSTKAGATTSFALSVRGALASSGTVLATLLKGIFNISPAMTVLEVVAWVGYLVPTMFLYFHNSKPVTVPATPAESASAAAEVEASTSRTTEAAG